MALARAYLKKNLLLLHRHNQRVLPLVANQHGRLYAAPAASEKATEGREVEVAKTQKPKPSPRRRRGFWRDDGSDIIPFGFNDLFRHKGLENALVQMSENMNRLLENLVPSRLFGRMKEDAKSYKLRFEVPGLNKEDLRITIEDGYLMIKGEHKDEEGETSDDDQWFSKSYGYYYTSLLLPDDAKVEEIKAELKDGLLNLTIPRSENKKKDVKQVEIN